MQTALKPNSDRLYLVSCSNLVPVKRIDKIIGILRCLQNFNVTWVHYGDGPLMNWLVNEIKTLPDNIKVYLKGNVPNKALMEEYKNNYFDLFVNLSDSEGLPVSIMEAMSFGIPCLATAVGGTPEIVENAYNGFLVDVNATPKAISDIILQNKEKLFVMRDYSRKSWETKFSGDNNYSIFIDELKNLLQGNI